VFLQSNFVIFGVRKGLFLGTKSHIIAFIMEAGIRVNSWNQDHCDPSFSRVINAPKNIDTLYFPCQITEEIGLSKGRINFLRNLGCRFFGRKTTIRWVREFLTSRAMGVPPTLQLS
jgi:hypothetical protein